jgi:hypothetical protein
LFDESHDPENEHCDTAAEHEDGSDNSHNLC